MNRDEWNGKPDEVVPWRSFLRPRDGYPTGAEGLVVEDNDQIARRWGPNYGLDNIGAWKLIEWKYGWGVGLETAQIQTFGAQDYLWRLGEKARLGKPPRYEGFYVGNYIEQEWTIDTQLMLNGFDVNGFEYGEWVQGRHIIIPAQEFRLGRNGYFDLVPITTEAQVFS